MNAASFVYLLCFVTSAACAWLLSRSWDRSRERLLLWNAAGFVFFAIGNFILFSDMVLLPTVDLTIPRYLAALAGVSTLIVGFVWATK
jgi:hypothetical protein